MVADAASFDASTVFGAHVQCPDTEGRLRDFSGLARALHAGGGRLSIGVDPLAAMLVKSAGAMGADVAIGSAQRFADMITVDDRWPDDGVIVRALASASASSSSVSLTVSRRRRTGARARRRRGGGRWPPARRRAGGAGR